MNKRLTLIAVVACVCGLLFSGAASARQAADTITVTGVIVSPTTSAGTYVQFWIATVGTTPFRLSLSGGSNYHFSWRHGNSGCKLTPANGGLLCDVTLSGGPVTNEDVDTLISGTLPTAVTGTVVYADNSTATLTAPLTVGPPFVWSGGAGAVRKGTSIRISGSSFFPPITQFSVDGGSNWHVTAINSNSGSCGLTPSNGGGSCTFAEPLTSFVLNLTFSGTPPTDLVGQITWGPANTTNGWSWRFPCNCTKTSAELTGFKERDHSNKLVFFFKWQLDCNVGSRYSEARARCVGAIVLHRPRPPHGFQLQQAEGKAWKRGTLYFNLKCAPKVGTTCKPVLTREKELELIGPAAARAHETVNFRTLLHCGWSGPDTRTTRPSTGTREDLTLTFDKHGNLDRKNSHLGKLS